MASRKLFSVACMKFISSVIPEKTQSSNLTTFSIMTMLWDEQLGFNYQQGLGFFSSPPCQD